MFCMHQTNIIMKKMFAKNVDLIRHDKLKQNACWFFAKKIVKILLHSNIKLNARFATWQGYPLNYCHLFLFCFFLRIILMIAQLETLKNLKDGIHKQYLLDLLYIQILDTIYQAIHMTIQSDTILHKMSTVVELYCM